MHNLVNAAESLPQAAWRPFVPSARRHATPKKKRRRRPERPRRTARRRGKRDLGLQRQWIAEMPYRPARSRTTYRLIIRRRRIEESHRGQLFELWRNRLALTNITDRRAQDVLELTYRRCDQESIIEQSDNGIAGMGMPRGSLLANAAYLGCARLAHNFQCWLAQLALPIEAVRRE